MIEHNYRLIKYLIRSKIKKLKYVKNYTILYLIVYKISENGLKNDRIQL